MKKANIIIATGIYAFAFYGAQAQNWKVTGNSATTPATEFLGTIDNVQLNFRTNNAVRMSISNTGNVGIGTTTPASKLDINGQLRITDGTQGAGKVLTSDANGMASWQVQVPGLSNGSAAGNTPYWNGSSWVVNSNNIFNNGGNVGIGTATPSGKLDVNGQIKISDGTQGAGKVLTSDANGLATWQTPIDYSANSWSLLGNSGTVDGTNFIGTTDNTPLNFRMNNQAAGRIELTLLNTFFGYQTGTMVNSLGNDNSAFGYQALYSCTQGDDNTAIGKLALYSDNAGYANTATGVQALYSNTSGALNSAFGHAALYFNISGILNNAMGHQALYNNTTGSHNIGIGYFSLFNNTDGVKNTAVGSLALSGNVSSQFNAALGYAAGASFQHGYNNVFLGANTNTDADDYYNVIACGQGTIVLSPSTARFGNSATISYGGWANWTNVSDGRFKKNIQENVPGLVFIDKLRPITYTLDATGLDAFMHRNVKDNLSEEAKAVHQKALHEKEKITYTGFIAQEVEASAKESGFDFSGVDAAKNENDVYGLRYAEFVVPLVKAVQELDAMNTELKSEVQNLKNEIADMKVSMGISSPNTSNEQSAVLYQNTPNPFTEKTTIKYFIPSSASRGEIKLYSANGKEIKSLIISEKGNSQIEINGNSLPAGIYNYNLFVDGKLAGQRQLILTK